MRCRNNTNLDITHSLPTKFHNTARSRLCSRHTTQWAPLTSHQEACSTHQSLLFPLSLQQLREPQSYLLPLLFLDSQELLATPPLNPRNSSQPLAMPTLQSSTPQTSHSNNLLTRKPNSNPNHLNSHRALFPISLNLDSLKVSRRRQRNTLKDNHLLSPKTQDSLVHLQTLKVHQSPTHLRLLNPLRKMLLMRHLIRKYLNSLRV